ncbi:FecR domain-containing protein [Sphingomonas sp.]|uniref:FecR family protein n=1 Tax=Sphingomonas sp. TaxID=28214 RepID=UPI002609C68D|nr:FecR domain-containing protein [Sphingomonas sp.]MDF2603670.1 hypothetical protein [Sphingomonas sp.]
MNGKSEDALREEGRLWAIRLRAPDFADWDDFTTWLEADPAHNAAYEAALDEMDAADALFDAPPEPAAKPKPAWSPAPAETPAAPVQPNRRSGAWRMPAVAAASVVMAVGGSWIAFQGSDTMVYATQPGERRELDLADGSHIILNGGTRLTIDRDNPRQVELASGEALFTVHHSDTRPFIVTTPDGTRLTDIGTVFNVVADRGALDVAVAEGAVVYRGPGGEMRLDAGQMLVRPSASAAPEKRAVDTSSIGTWRTGYLQFNDATLADVARQLDRNIGAPVAVAPDLAHQRFTGTIMLDGGPAAVMARFGPLAEVTVTRDGQGWRMAPRDGARR